MRRIGSGPQRGYDSGTKLSSGVAWKVGVSSTRCPRSWGGWSWLKTEVREWPQFCQWEDLPHAFHTPDKHLIVGYREAGCGLPFISNHNDDDDDDNSNQLLSA